MNGYRKATSINWFYNWHGRDENPDEGTVNQILGFNSTKCTKRYTKPIIHSESTAEYRTDGTIDEIIGEVQDFIFFVDENCPESKLAELEENSTAITDEQVIAQGFVKDSEEE